MGKAKDIILRPISRKRANEFTKRVHYSGKVMSNSQIHIGVYLSGSLEGVFQFGHIIPNEYSIRALAEVNEAPAKGFAVKDMLKRIYSVSESSVVDKTSYDMKINIESGVAGAFNILDVLTSAAEYSRDNMQINTENLSAFWEVGNEKGTAYCSDFESR